MKFQTETNGYIRQQVDAVFKELTDRYQQLYEQYNAVNSTLGGLHNERDTLAATNKQLMAEAENKRQENGWLTQKIHELEKNQNKEFSAPVNDLSPREFWDLILRHAASIISDAKSEAAGIIQKAKDETTAMQALKARTYMDMQNTISTWQAHPAEKN